MTFEILNPPHEACFKDLFSRPEFVQSFISGTKVYQTTKTESYKQKKRNYDITSCFYKKTGDRPPKHPKLLGCAVRTFLWSCPNSTSLRFNIQLVKFLKKPVMNSVFILNASPIGLINAVKPEINKLTEIGLRTVKGLSPAVNDE